MSLYSRIVKTGTLSERKGVPDPLFALPSTVNWMHALAMIVQAKSINFKSAIAAYSAIQTRLASEHEQNTIFEQLLFAVHQCSALNALKQVPSKADISRVGIITWYYGIYAAASAMVAAQDGSFQEDHAGTSRVWDTQIAGRGFALQPFHFRLVSLVKKTSDAELAKLYSGPKFDLAGKRPITIADAESACVAYLSGNANYWRWRSEQDVRDSKEFKSAGFSDFRKRDAQVLRDKRLAGRSIGFLHQAFRYRGKANYREALFLGYGPTIETTLKDYPNDLALVLEGFIAMAGAFCSRRLGPKLWTDFVSDVESKRAFTMSAMGIWS